MKRTVLQAFVMQLVIASVFYCGVAYGSSKGTSEAMDVPQSNWAYKDLQKAKEEGLLVGYPDGLFRGSRPASRYEMAVAVHSVYINLQAKLMKWTDEHYVRLPNAQPPQIPPLSPPQVNSKQKLGVRLAKPGIPKEEGESRGHSH